jgi:DNA polymerase I-like protein with 3'-5' exonuclease and polymerase domains
MNNHVFLNCDFSQAEGRVVALLSDDEETLKMYDEHDIHALTASWFIGGTEEKYSKKILGYECPERFLGKTTRHAGNLGAGKRRLSIEVNNQARKYGIPVMISESRAEHALKIFHMKSPKIQGVFHAGIIECLKNKRQLIAPIPYGIQSKYGGKRTFYERWGDELFRMAFSYIPQRAVSDNTKAAALRIRHRLPKIKIVMEAHDALLFSIPIPLVDEYANIIKREMERPIIFENCSLTRHDLIIPCDVEIGENYADFVKYKFPTITV